jgi:hypothetical protein
MKVRSETAQTGVVLGVFRPSVYMQASEGTGGARDGTSRRLKQRNAVDAPRYAAAVGSW